MSDLKIIDNIENVPIEIIEQGKEAIKVWFSENEKIPVNEAKVLFVGEGASGKTSLIKQLQNLPFDKNEPETKGININDFEVDSNHSKITLHLWDFGGQEYLHSTHQFFLSRRSLYVLVLDGRVDEKKYYWLRMIESFGGTSPVIVIMNKIDQKPAFRLNETELRQKFPNIFAFYRISCATREGIDKFIEGLSQVANQIEMVHTPWIKKWFNIREKLIQVTTNFISYTQFLEICNNETVKDEQAQITLVEYLDNLGILLHFSEFDLQDTHILNPHWVTNAVYRIISYDKIELQNGEMPLKWLRDILSKRNDNDFDYPDDKQRFIIHLMKKFELCFAIDSENVLIPDLLSVNEPEIKFDFVRSLKFIYHYEDFLSKSIIPRLMVKMKNDIEKKWRTGMLLRNNEYKTLVLIKSDEEKNDLKIYIEGEQKRDYYAILRNYLNEISESYKNDWNELVPCNCKTCQNNENPTLFVYTELKSRLRFRTTIDCKNEPYYPVEIKELIDDLLNHRPKDWNEQLLNDILWCAKEIQAKHLSLNNDENRYNDLFVSLLEAKSYIVKQEARQGTSETGKDVGRLDLKISHNNQELALFEALKLTSFGKTGQEYAMNHALKLLINYNPNGTKHCFVVLYVEMKNFDDVWQNYKFEKNIEQLALLCKIPKRQMLDLTEEYIKNCINIRLGLTEHFFEGQMIKLYHVFMNMNF